MRQTYALFPLKIIVIAVVYLSLSRPLAAAFIDNPDLPSMTFESWSGYNPQQHATQETAEALAQMMGGTVVETDPIAPPDSGMPRQRLIWLGGSRYLNAGLAAVTFMNNPYEVAMGMLMADGYSEGYDDWGADSFGNSLGDEDWGWNPFGSFGDHSESINGGLNLQPQHGAYLPTAFSEESEAVAEPASLLLIASGLMALVGFRRRLTA